MRLASLCLCLITLLPGVAAAQDVRFPPPSLRAGEFRVDLRVRFHFDVRGLDTDPVGKDDFIWRRARVALEGRLYDDLEYEVDADARDTENPWRDVFLNYRRFRSAEIQGGKFKVPFGLDQLTSVFSNSFVARSRTSGSSALRSHARCGSLSVAAGTAPDSSASTIAGANSCRPDSSVSTVLRSAGE